jgi:hypothetical protein
LLLLLLQVEEAELARLLAPQGLVLRDIPVRSKPPCILSAVLGILT